MTMVYASAPSRVEREGLADRIELSLPTMNERAAAIAQGVADKLRSDRPLDRSVFDAFQCVTENYEQAGGGPSFNAGQYLNMAVLNKLANEAVSSALDILMEFAVAMSQAKVVIEAYGIPCIDGIDETLGKIATLLDHLYDVVANEITAVLDNEVLNSELKAIAQAADPILTYIVESSTRIGGLKDGDELPEQLATKALDYTKASGLADRIERFDTLFNTRVTVTR
jgi:hypothetical protein